MSRAFKITGILLVLLVILLMGPRVFEQYRIKKRVAEIVQLAEGVRERIDPFYRLQKRLPTAHEAARFRIDGDGSFQSIVFDAERKMIVVTMPVRDEQFAIRADDKGGTVS